MSVITGRGRPARRAGPTGVFRAVNSPTRSCAHLGSGTARPLVLAQQRGEASHLCLGGDAVLASPSREATAALASSVVVDSEEGLDRVFSIFV